MSHNPFRKARDQQIELPTADAAIVAGIFDFREEARQEQATTQPPTTKSGKPKKRVVIKTPPRSPEETQRRYSFRGPDSPLPRTAGHALGGDEGYGDITAEDAGLREAINNARRNSVGTTTLPVDPVASGGGGASESGDVLEQPAQSPDEAIPVIKARANPFAKTLATTEQKYGLLEDDKEATSASKPTFDIDMFKNILLNGATPPPRPKPATDTDETSEHRKSTAQDDFQHRFLSLDGPVKSALPEAPHLLEDESSSSDDSDDSDDEAMELAPTATSTGPETVTFDDLKSSQPVLKTSDPTSSTALIEEKPLPVLPSTEPRAAMPPPPPVARRQAHTTPSEGRRRSSSIMSRSSVQSDASSIAATPTNEKTRAPPPPPSRRAQPVKTPSAISPDSETTTASAARQSTAAPPAPAPRRAPSKAVRTTGSSSRQALSALNEHSSSIVPPRPPARRAGESNRSSIDGSAIRRSSGQDSRRTSNDLETPEAVRSQADLLSDLAALQREVDELRARAGPG